MVKRVIGEGRNILMKAVKNIAKSTVKVGFFAEQGKHYSGFSYPALMYLHEVHGIPASNGKVYRRAFETAMQIDRKLLIAQAQKNLKRMLSTGQTNPDLVLSQFGKDSIKSLKKVFGNPSLLPPNTPSTIKSKGGRNTPLVDTSYLVDNLAYKTSNRGGLRK